jgi:DNA polymerase III subunit epsilon
MNVESYLACFASTWPEDAPAESVRFVVLDTETTGLDPRRDRIITIGAIAVRGGDILLDDAFEVMCRLDYNRASVTVHGITRDETRDAFEEPDALLHFLAYLRDGVIVGHHIGHDIQALNAACSRHFGIELRNRSLDTMDLALRIHAAGAFGHMAMAQGFSLDALCEMFSIPPHDRHTAGGDAFVTAQVFQRLLRYARRAGLLTLDTLAEPYRNPD